jgi:hypothetical protein
MKKAFLLLATLIVVNFVVMHYFLNEQFTIINLLVISAIGGIFGFLFSRYGTKPKEK